MPQQTSNSSEVTSECLLSDIWVSDYCSGTLMDGGYIALCLVNSLTSLTLVAGNLLIILATWRTRSLHTPSFLLLGCLGVTDFLIGLVSQPAFVLLYILRRTETFVEAYCLLYQLAAYFGATFLGSSFLLLITVAIDKYLAIKLHLRYNEFVIQTQELRLLFHVCPSSWYCALLQWLMSLALSSLST